MDDRGTNYGTIIELDGCLIEIIRDQGTYYLCLSDGHTTRGIPIRSMTAMDIIGAARKNADLRKW